MKKDLEQYIKKLSLNDKKTLSQKCGKVTEENGELSGAILAYESASGYQDKIVGKDSILEESIDVILSALSIPLAEGYTMDDVYSMIHKKCLHWEQKQNKESKVSFPIWFETHVTVECPTDIDKYKKDCAEIGVKPIVLELENNKEIIMHDVMTSSKHFGDNSSAMEYTTKITSDLVNMGYKVVREKIESVPYHPSAPRDSDITYKMPKDCYFESHIGVKIYDDDVDEKKELEKYFKDSEIHISRNFFKKYDGYFILMMTYRNYDCTLEWFENKIETLKSKLVRYGFEYEKVIIEFSVFDTKVSHDLEWLKEN